MNPALLRQHLETYREHILRDPALYAREAAERRRLCAHFQDWSAERLLDMDAAGLHGYLSDLEAFDTWSRKQDMVDKLIQDNGLDPLRRALADLQWGLDPLPRRWDLFKAGVKGFGPAIMSEILCYAHPDQCMVWNRRSYTGFLKLGVRKLPLHGYQLTGGKYAELTLTAQAIADQMKDYGIQDVSLPAVDTLLRFRPNLRWSQLWGQSWFKDM
jgi:hypothetical protein